MTNNITFHHGVVSGIDFSNKGRVKLIECDREISPSATPSPPVLTLCMSVGYLVDFCLIVFSAVLKDLISEHPEIYSE